jgi:amidophosphoribosyltransferase
MGVDMATYKQLIAHRLNIEEIRERIGTDSLGYLSLPGMLKAIRETISGETGHCTACFSGEYPIRVPDWLFAEDRDKMVFETVWGE